MKKKLLLFLLIFIFGITNVKAIPSDAVAEIDGSYYKSIALAIKAIDTDAKTTITLVKDRTENITIPNNRNIVLDLNGYTLRNSGANSTVITNNGILEIKNGTVTTDASSGMINNNSDAVLTINSGNYIATYSRQVLYNKSGTATIGGTAYLESNTSERATVHNLNGGTLNIVGGTIVANNSYAVYNDIGTLNIGTKDEVYNQNSPVIQGSTYGVIANDEINIYDGIIKGKTYHLGKANSSNAPTVSTDTDETKVSDIEELAEKVLDEEEISGDTYHTFKYWLDSENIVKITFDPVGGTVNPTYKKIFIGDSVGELPTPIKVDNKFNGWFTSSSGGAKITGEEEPTSNITYYAQWTYVDPNKVAYVEGIGYMSLENAFLTGGNIKLMEDVIVINSLEMNVAANLDLNGHQIILGNNKITINEEVTIDDSSDDKTGLITSNALFGIIVGSETTPTNGSLTLKGGTIEGKDTYGAIRNFEELEIDGGTVLCSGKCTGHAVYNNNELTMKSGTVYSEKGRAIRNSDNGTFTMDGGLVKIDSKKEQALDLGGNCSATINGGTIEALNENGAAIASFGNTELTVNGGTIKGYDMAIAGNGNDNNKNVSITINGGDIIATNGVGMYLPQQDSTTIINGGNISGTSGIEIRAANLIVNGGNIVGTADHYEIKTNDNGTTSTGAAIAVSQHTTKKPIVVEINGGNLKGMSPIAEGNPQSNPQDAIDQVTITIKDGDFESNGDSVISAENPETIIQLVTGGTYNEDPSYYVKDGYGAAKIGENQYEVTKIHNITLNSKYIKIDKDKYPYKSTVEINIDNSVINPVIEIYDANGNKMDIEVKNNKFIMPDHDIVINIQYDEIINPSTGDSINSYILLLLSSILGLLCVKVCKIKTTRID
ncbi:MAG: InlB B-repeat-containing protein [Bacilli bacterium]|nr:InlB B-repeat-containing protein [Bacilli bacterium]